MLDLTDPQQRADIETTIQQAREQDTQHYQRLRGDARAVYHALEDWCRVDTPEDWQRICEESRQAYQSGQFLIERLGAERYLEPTLMAVLWQLRRGLLNEGEDRSAADMMLADLSVLSYYNVLRIQGWIGNLALLLEHEVFGQESPTVKFRKHYGSVVEGLQVEDYARQLSEQLLPLLDRANRMVLRNLKTLREFRQGPTPAVAIGKAEQVNVAHQQVNTTGRD